ncbi:hypothetical protein PVAND_012412 [Polypedilum vanderplanki]|uniref:Uncharacterized protein n=1 Tax=Polypedilum vanderplanki TaxID=319348 RepID=A0A9J6CNC1_POLVA|nr:hypothetical protein PVAND_012412 [Polypedilum vanderplanki]
MDSSPDLSMKLRRGSSDSRDSFYMGFAQGIDSDIEEVTTIQNIPPPPLFPAQEEPPIDLPLPPPVAVESELPELSETQESSEQEKEEQEKQSDEHPQVELVEKVIEIEEIKEQEALPEPEQVTEDNEEVIMPEIHQIVEEIPPPLPTTFIPTSSIQIDDDEDETNTSATVIPIKSKPPSSSSSSISSAENELIIDEQIKPQQIQSPPRVAFTSSPARPLETDFALSRSPPSKKSSHSSRKSQSSSSLSLKSPISQKSLTKSPPKHLDLNRNELRQQRQLDSDSIESINAIDCKIDDDNRDDSSPTDSMPPIPTPPPLEPLTLLEKR